MYRLAELITLTTLIASSLYSQPTVIYSNGNAEFYQLDPASCSSDFLFKAEFPGYFNDFDQFISGFTFDAEGNLLAVNGTHLMEIDVETGRVTVIDSIAPQPSGIHKWYSIATGHNGLIYLGTDGLFIYDLKRKELIRRPPRENSLEHYFGGDMAWYDTVLLNYNRFLHLIEWIHPVTLRQLWWMDTDFTNFFFGLTYVSESCDGGTNYGMRADNDTTLFIQIDWSSRAYDTLCEIIQPYCYGLSSVYELKERLLDIQSNHLVETDPYGKKRILLQAGCKPDLERFIDFDIVKCTGIDSIVFHCSAGIHLEGSGLRQIDSLKFIWENTDLMTNGEINTWLRQLALLFVEKKHDYRIDAGIYSGAIRSSLTMEIERHLDDCIQPGTAFYFPNAFTPNGDGTNDVYQAFTTSDVELIDFKIYNSIGQLVYRKEEAKEVAWDGGDQLPGVFIYLSTLRDHFTGGVNTFSGSITLIK
jgi:gliding motility-associated-like protein